MGAGDKPGLFMLVALKLFFGYKELEENLLTYVSGVLLFFNMYIRFRRKIWYNKQVQKLRRIKYGRHDFKLCAEPSP